MIHFPDSRDSRYSLNHYINRSWIMYFRCLYLTYCVFLANMYILIEGFSFGVLLFYSFKHAESNENKFRIIGRGKGIQLSAMGIVIVGTMMLSTILSKGVEFLFIIWKKDQYSEISRRVLKFLGVNPRSSKFQLVDFIVQGLLVLYLEIIPITAGVFILIIYAKTDLTFGMNCIYSFGSIAALALILVWWVLSFIANYKRLFLFCLRKGKRFYSRVEAITEGPVKRRYFLPSDIIIDGSCDEITPLDQESNESHAAAVRRIIKKQRNLFVVLYVYLWRHPIRVPLPQFCRGADPARSALIIRPKHIYFTIAASILVLFVLMTGIFNLWRIFTVSGIALGCCVFDFILNRIIFIPRHDPSRHRLRASWSIEGKHFFLHRFIAVFEEVYFLSPAIVFGLAKMSVYVHVLLITVCLLFGFYGGYTIFLPSLFGCALIVVLYSLRFNLKRTIIIARYMYRSLFENDEEVSEINNSSPPSERNPLLNSDLIVGRTRRSSSITETLSDIARLLSQDDDDATTESEIDLSRKGYLHVHYESESLRLISVFTVVSLILVSCILLFFVNLFYLGVIPALVFLLCLSTVSFIIFRRYEKNTAPIWNAFFYLFVIFVGILFVMGSIEIEPKYDHEYATVGNFIHPETPRYDVCDATWEGYNIIDYALWAHLAYEQEPYASQDFQTWFPHIANSSHELNYYNHDGGLVFFDLHIRDKNLSIIGIRGTNSFLDVIQDMYMWKEIIFLQIASIIGPFSNFWPVSLTIEIVNAIAKVEQFVFDRYSYNESGYYNVLDEYMAKILKTRNAVIVGHSLGGGLAGIIGSKHQKTVIAFSAPGIVYISKKVGITLESINRIVMNVRPNNDIVPTIDLGAGFSQQIDCYENFLECHRLTNTIKTLIKSCGNMPLGRYIKDDKVE